MHGPLNPPVAERRPSERVVHGTTLTDDYAWLKAGNWQEVLRDPALLPADIRAHLEAENAFAAQELAPSDALRETIFAELKGRIKPDDASVPAPDGPYAYYVRFREGGQHRLHCRQPREGGSETVLLDGDALAQGKAFFQLGGASHSYDHRLIAWSADDKGSEFYDVRVLDMTTGEALADVVPDTGGGVVWDADGRSFIYVRVDENNRPSRVHRHRLGTPGGDDVLVHEEADVGMFVSLGETHSRRFAAISIDDYDTSEVRLVELGAAGRCAAHGRAARRRRAVRRRAPPFSGRRRGTRHPHERRRRGGLQDRHRSAG